MELVVRDLTDFHEANRTASSRNPPVWSVDDAPSEFIARQLRAIVGLEMTIERIEAKRNLSQNRSESDQAGVRAGLRDGHERRHSDVADAMER